MISMVTKRDGRVVPYDENRVRTAIQIAITTTNCGSDDPEVIVDKILSKVTDRLNTLDDDYTTINVEEIQDIVVDSMKSLDLTKLARSFTSYRNKRTRIREKKSSLMKAMQEMDSSDAKNSNSKRENANINGDTAMGTMLKFGTTASKAYYLTDVIPEKASKAHIDGDIHIHDMDFYSLTTTCTQIDIGKLLDRGFSTGHGHLRTPNGILTGAALTCIAIQSNQNDQHGGQSIPTFDYGLAPYVSKTFITNICEYLDNNEVSEEDIKTIRENLKEYNNTHKSIMCKEALADIEKIIYSVIGTSYVIPSMCIDKALKHTDRDTYQAMEAMVHNLNTMNCMHRTQCICVYKPISGFREFSKLSNIEQTALANLLRKLYEQDNLTMIDIAERLGMKRLFVSELFDRFGIQKRTKKENSEAVANRLVRTIGVSNAMKLPENIAKVRNTQYERNDGKYAFNTEKREQTCLQRYGSTNPMTGSDKDRIMNKIRKTNMERYGTPCSLQNETVKNKAQQTCLKLYGDIYIMGRNSSIRQNMEPFGLSTPKGNKKAKDAQRAKYNGHWGFGDAETLEKIKHTCKELYGYENPALPCMHGKAKSEDLVVNFLKQQLPDIEIVTNKRSLMPSNKRLEVDIYIPEYKFAIEINGSYSHDKDLYLDDVLNETCYSKEMKKCKLLHEQGIKLIHIWEDDLYENTPLKLNRILYKLLKWMCMDEEDD